MAMRAPALLLLLLAPEAAAQAVPVTPAPTPGRADMDKCLKKLMDNVNKRCCQAPGVSCNNGHPSKCTVACAHAFAPFYSECAPYLKRVPNLNLDSIMAMCQKAGGSAGTSHEVMTVGGFVNGGFDDEKTNFCTYVCGPHEWAPLRGQKCGHKYQSPTGWGASGSGAVMICNPTKDQPFLIYNHGNVWGGLSSGSGPNYVAIQGQHNFIEQTVTGLTPGRTYEVSFLATHRPGMGDTEQLRVLANGKMIFHTRDPGKSGAAFHQSKSGSDPFRPYTAPFVATSKHVTIRFQNDSPAGDQTVFLDHVKLQEGHGWVVDRTCEARWGPWKLATEPNLRKLAYKQHEFFQYKYAATGSKANGAYYISPITQQVWDWSHFQALSGEYFYVDSSKVSDSFHCAMTQLTDRELTAFNGIGCTNFEKDGPKNVFTREERLLSEQRGSSSGAATATINQVHPDGFQTGGNAPARVYFRESVSPCHPEMETASWTLVAANKRVSDADEDRVEHPWEWRHNEMTLGECKAECHLYATCAGIEYESGEHDGKSDCIMLRKLTPAGSASGFNIYAKPGVIAASGGVELSMNFNERKAVDASGHGRDGVWEGREDYHRFVIPGAKWTHPATVSKYPLVIGHASTLGLTDNSFTVMAWVKQSAHDAMKHDLGDHAIFGTDETSSGKGLHLIVRGQKYYMGFYGNDCRSPDENERGIWEHVIFMYDKVKRTQMIFVNGVRVASCAGRASFKGTGVVRLGQWAGGRHWEGLIENARIFPRVLSSTEITQAKLGSSASFDGKSRIRVDAFNGFKWTDKFSVSLWFHRTKNDGNYQGIVNNGYYSHGSFEVRMGRENGGTMMGGGVVTPGHPKAWDHVNLHATLNSWHHVAMVYTGGKLHFWLDGHQEKHAANDRGPLKSTSTPVVIGQAGPGTGREFFTGYIDDVQIFSKEISQFEIGIFCACKLVPAAATGTGSGHH